jgi:hypothetical protein
VLRFSDPESQLVLIVYASWKSELVSYTLEGPNGKPYSQYIADRLRAQPQLSDEELTAAVHVSTSRSFPEPSKIEDAIEGLRGIKLSPFLEMTVPVDEFSNYEYWLDSGEDSVHYKLHGPVQRTSSTGQLVRWMIDFRKNLR